MIDRTLRIDGLKKDDGNKKFRPIIVKFLLYGDRRKIFINK